MHWHVKDRTGERVGVITIHSYSHSESDHAVWKGICDCGRERLVASNHIRIYRKFKSCSCEVKTTRKASTKKGHCRKCSAKLSKSRYFHCERCTAGHHSEGEGFYTAEDWGYGVCGLRGY